MYKTKVEELNEFGQSVWLDNISRSMVTTGKLNEMLRKGLRGMTSNPTIFDKSISKSNDYDEKILELASRGKSTFQIYDDLTIKDVQDAADIFEPIYQQTNGLDGYVSLEVNPQLALKAKETIQEARRLYKKVNRPNVMFKVPSTNTGFQAIEELLAEGININITLIFSQEQYEKTAEAYLKGIERLSRNTNDLSKICSVASCFVSRIDTAVDKLLDEEIAQQVDERTINRLQSLKGKAAVANSKIIYRRHIDIFSSKEFESLKEKGAKLQRVLWGSTSTKNPLYSDIKYVTELIGKNTVNTMPEVTFDAFLDHGVVKEALTSDIKEAKDIIKSLKDFGINIDDVCKKLLNDGVAAFENSFLSLLNSLEEKARVLCKK